MLQTLFSRLAMRGAPFTGAHLPNPDHLPHLVEPRARGLIAALEGYGGDVFASCAGHGRMGGVPYWPHFAFLLDPARARVLAERLHDHPALAYRWSLAGHFMPRFGFDLGIALSISDRQKFDLGCVNADLRRLAGAIQAMGAGGERV